MRKHGGTPSRRDKHVTLAAISPPGVARGRFVLGQQSGLAGSKPPPLFTREASSCSSQGRRQGEPWGASPRPSAPTYVRTYLPTVTTTVAVAYTANIGVTRRPRWSHRSRATTKIHQATPSFPRPADWVGMQVRIRTNSLELEFAPNSHEFVDPSEFEFATSNSNSPLIRLNSPEAENP